MPYRLLAIDIDGTLVDLQDQITPVTRAALRRAQAAGIQVVLATGRRYARTLPLVAPLELNLPLVTASGALIKRPLDHQTLYRAAFGEGALRDTLALLEKRGYDAVVYADSYGQGFDFYCPRLQVRQPEMLDFFSRNAGCAREFPLLMTNPPEGIFAGFAIGPRAEMLALADELDQALAGQLSVHVLRSPRYLGFMCEIAPAGVSKWSGIRHLAHDLGIADDEICAVGDDVNDIPMIVGAGLGVAMGNALDEVKAVADRVAPSNKQDGLATVVDWLLE